MKFGCLFGIFLHSAHLICRSTDISKCFSGSLRLRDNESRLYFSAEIISTLLLCILEDTDEESLNYNFLKLTMFWTTGSWSSWCCERRLATDLKQYCLHTNLFLHTELYHNCDTSVHVYVLMLEFLLSKISFALLGLFSIKKCWKLYMRFCSFHARFGQYA